MRHHVRRPAGVLPVLRAAMRRRRVRGPWRAPAAFPCDFTAADRLRCELASAYTWCLAPGRINAGDPRWETWHPHTVGQSCVEPQERHYRCALHPMIQEGVS